MSTPSEPITDPAAGNPTDPGTTPAEHAEPTTAAEPGTPPEGGTGDEPLGPPGVKALEEWKRRAKEAEQQAKDQAAKLKAYEDAEKTEAERQADALAAATARAEQLQQLAVSSKVEALAAGRFQDPMDAVEALKGGTFLSEDGAVDTEAIKGALEDLLTRKPHWAAAEPGPRIPKPDPAQGARPGTPPNLSQRIAEAEQSGDHKLALALKTQQLRELKTTSK